MSHTAPQKSIIVIGASSGLGERIAIDFASRGWRVGVAARREDRLQAIVDRFAPGEVIPARIDVTADDCVDRFNHLVERMGSVDVVAYCAGVGYQDANADDAILSNTLRTNVDGFARIITAAYHHFEHRTASGGRRGQIAAITSVAGTAGIGISAAYSASKRFESTYIDALDQLAMSRRAGVDFTDIRPGFIRTALLSDSRHYPMEMTVDYAAQRIVRAIMRRRRVAYIDWRWGLIVRLWRLIPRWLWRRLRLDL